MKDEDLLYSREYFFHGPDKDNPHVLSIEEQMMKNLLRLKKLVLSMSLKENLLGALQHHNGMLNFIKDKGAIL